MLKTKQVIVMRTDLNMRKGKMAAQAAHASLAAILNRMNTVQISDPLHDNFSSIYKKELVVNSLTALDFWLKYDFTKICVGIDSEEELLELYNKVKEANIPVALIQDSGKTEFKGKPTYTCLCIGPEFNSVIDPFTQRLKLL